MIIQNDMILKEKVIALTKKHRTGIRGVKLLYAVQSSNNYLLRQTENNLDQPKPTKTSKPTKAGSRVFPPEEKQ